MRAPPSQRVGRAQSLSSRSILLGEPSASGSTASGHGFQLLRPRGVAFLGPPLPHPPSASASGHLPTVVRLPGSVWPICLLVCSGRTKGPDPPSSPELCPIADLAPYSPQSLVAVELQSVDKRTEGGPTEARRGGCEEGMRQACVSAQDPRWGPTGLVFSFLFPNAQP